MLLFHLALPEDWAEARRRGEYTVSTRGLSLAQVGFVHGAHAHQVTGVRERFYADVPELLLLHIETDLLTSPWREDPVPDSPEPFPHIYGPLNLDAVVAVEPLAG